MFLVPILIL